MRRSRAKLLLVAGACAHPPPAAGPSRASCDRPAAIASQADVVALAHCTTLPELIIKIVSDPPIPLPGGAVPERLEGVIVRCLQKDRGKRFETVGELVFGQPSARSSCGDW